MQPSKRSPGILIVLLALLVGALALPDGARAQDGAGAPPPGAAAAATSGPRPVPSVEVLDRPWDGGTAAILVFPASPDDPRLATNAERVAAGDPALVATYVVEFAVVPRIVVRRGLVENTELQPADFADLTWDGQVALPVTAEGAELAEADIQVTVGSLTEGRPYVFRVLAINATGEASAPTLRPIPFIAKVNLFDGNRLSLLIILLIFGGSVVWFIFHARAGGDLKIRKIAGLAAVDEAVGRATEMGRSVLYIPGIQDVNDIQTIAGLNVLSRVAKTAAEYDARVEVPTARSLVMTTARETVQAAFLGAGRPDAYNPDNIYYVTDEQFGYVAYLQGHMAREKPAACFYMGAFFAESLILAETGNSIGAIQVAGTAMPAQLPFFVAACDYTLIGEEFFAASAYLSGEPDQLGSLKGQDVGKVIVAVLIVLGVAIITIGTILEAPLLIDLVEFLKGRVLT